MDNIILLKTAGGRQNRDGLNLLFLIITLNLILQHTQAANWPLPDYEPCGVQPLSRPTSWEGGTTFPVDADLSYNSDDDLLWTTVGSTLYKFRFSDGHFIGNFTISAGEFCLCDDVSCVILNI